MRIIFSAILMAAAAAGIQANAATQTIDFEGLPAGSAIGTIGNATFSGDDGIIVYDFGGDYASSGVNTIAPNGGNFNGNVYVDFASHVNGLTFYSGGDDDAGFQASINVFVSGAFAALVELTGDGNFGTVDFQDLSTFSNVSRIEIFNVTDGAGLVYDGFSFSYDEITPVPLPASAPLLIAGVFGLGALRMRLRAKA